MSDLFAQIDGYLEAHKERMRGRAKFEKAMARAESELDLWSAIRPFLRSPDDYRAAAGFMAAWTRQRSRD